MKSFATKIGIGFGASMLMTGCLEGNVEKAKVQQCNTAENAFQQSTGLPITDINANVIKAQKMADLLFKRTELAHGGINIGEIDGLGVLSAPDGISELGSDNSTYSLYVTLQDNSKKLGYRTYDFHRNTDSKPFKISIGALACSGDGGLLYPTKFYATLESYVHVTDVLGAIG